jgi:hypothetical protein
MLFCAAAVLAVAGGAGAVLAQGPPPTVEVTVRATSMTVTGAEALNAGPARLEFTVPGGAERGFSLFELKPGVTREEAERAAPNIEEPSDAEELGRFVAGSIVDGGQTYTTTVTLSAGEYVLIDLTRRPAVRTGFTVGTAPNTAVIPEPDASISLEDYSFGGDATLPRRGTLRIENTGRRLHHALAFRLRRGVNGRKVARQLRNGKDPERAFAGQASALVEIVSPNTANDVELSATAGRYVLVCFVQNSSRGKPHAQLGMVRRVRVE